MHIIAQYDQTANCKFRVVLLFARAQSENENARVKAGLSERVGDYLEEIEDGANGPMLCLRDGIRKMIAPGSIVVNCTGSFFRTQKTSVMPCLSPPMAAFPITRRMIMKAL